MNLDQLPDQPRAGSDRTLATIANVAAIMNEVGIKARYNEIKKKVEIDLPEHRGTPDNLDNVTLTRVVSLAAEHAMPTGHIGEYVNAIADEHAYNPVADWISLAEWDRVDRLPALYATVVTQDEYPLALKELLLNRWLRSATAAALMPTYKGRGVLTLQGPQGIGKTSWVKALVGDQALCDSVVKLDHHMDGSNKDSILGAIGNWIVEIGELDSSFKKDIARLKGFLTADSDRVRRPYDRRESEYRRRTVFAATVNEASFLVDNTGNSRWWTIAVKDLDFHHNIDTQQLFAQLAVEVKGGAAWWLDRDEEAMLEAWNANHTTVSVVEDLVRNVIDLSETRMCAMTPTQVLQRAGITTPSNAQAKECAAVLRELFGPSKRINGRARWRVPLREPSANELYDREAPITHPKSGFNFPPGSVF